MSTGCPNWDAGYCVYQCGELPTNSGKNSQCFGNARCAWYQQWAKDQGMFDETVPSEVKAGKPPSDAQERKEQPVYSGVLKYFPLAMLAVAECSFKANQQHNPGTDMHWDRSKSGDELDALARHMLEAGTMDTDGIRHSTKCAWRALANLEKELEQANKEQA